jgi:hypothetical protein
VDTATPSSAAFTAYRAIKVVPGPY